MVKRCERQEKLEEMQKWLADGADTQQKFLKHDFKSAATRIRWNTEAIQQLSDQWKQLLAGGGKRRCALSASEQREYKHRETLTDNTTHLGSMLVYFLGLKESVPEYRYYPEIYGGYSREPRMGATQ